MITQQIAALVIVIVVKHMFAQNQWIEIPVDSYGKTMFMFSLAKHPCNHYQSIVVINTAAVVPLTIAWMHIKPLCVFFSAQSSVVIRFVTTELVLIISLYLMVQLPLCVIH